MNYPDIFKRGKFSIFVPMIKFWYVDLFNLILDNTDNLEKYLELLWQETKTESGHQWDNPQFFVSNSYGDLFTFNYYKNNLRIWDLHDFIVSHIELTSDKEKNKEILKEAKENMDIYSKGKIHCSDCGKAEEYKNIVSHRYFAGIYCDTCWNTKWKSIEAKENYS
jgi:hypothetical protein